MKVCFVYACPSTRRLAHVYADQPAGAWCSSAAAAVRRSGGSVYGGKPNAERGGASRVLTPTAAGVCCCALPWPLLLLASFM